MSLAVRCVQAEWMDDPGIDANLHRQALAGLARLNGVSGCARLLWSQIEPLAGNSIRPVRILDVATGAGDIPIRLAQRARRAQAPVLVSACDLSPIAVGYAARRAARAGVRVEFFQADVLKGGILGEYDVVLSSLFLHHLQIESAVSLLGDMAAAARRLVLVSDLHRSPFNYSIVRLASTVLTTSPVVRQDGPASVRAAFTAQEALSLARQAGLVGARISRQWPCRFLLSWSRL